MNRRSVSGWSASLSERLQALEHFYVTCKGRRAAEGVILPSGAFAMHWFGELSSHGTYPSLDVFRRIQAQMSGREIVRGDRTPERTFYLQRNEDWNGISGTGLVAVGFEFEQMAVLQWLSKNGSTFWYDSVAAVEHVHGHGGRTLVVRAKDISAKSESAKDASAELAMEPTAK